MDEDLLLCIASCQNSNNSSGALVGNDSYDLECITQCSQRHTTLYQHTAQKYTHIFRIIAVILITLGLIGKVFNCIIFLRRPLRGTSTGLLLLLKTIFDFVPLLWTFIFDTKFFVKDEQLNASRVICFLTRSSDIFISWSIGFVILACAIRLATILHSNYLPSPTRLHVFILILLMMCCGILYNWHVFYYPNLVQTILNEDNNETFTYCNILFGRQMGYFSFGGFQSTQELLYNAPIVNFIISSLIPFTIVASTNLVIIQRVLKNPALKMNSLNNGQTGSFNRSSIRYIRTHLTRKHLSYETTITLTTSFVFLTTNSIASIYVYVKSSYRSNRSRLSEDIKTSNVYLILRILSLIDTVLEFYIYFLTGKKFRQEVYQVIREILLHTPLKHYFKFTCLMSTNHYNPRPKPKNIAEEQLIHFDNRKQLQYFTLKQLARTTDSLSKHKTSTSYWCDTDEALDSIESTV